MSSVSCSRRAVACRSRGRWRVAPGCNDRQAAVLRIDRRADACRALVAEQQRRADFEIFDLDRDRLWMPGRSGRQSDLGESGTRENGGLANDMVGKHRIQLRIELIFPGQFVLRQRIAEQRVQLAPINQSGRCRRDRMPVAFSLPGIAG
jgi:hypothetical protein